LGGVAPGIHNVLPSSQCISPAKRAQHVVDAQGMHCFVGITAVRQCNVRCVRTE
jgi:hypothetical protein